MYINTLNLFLLHLQLKSKHILTKSLPPCNSPKSYTPVKNVHFPQILPTVLSIFAYYAGIMLNAFAFLLCSKLCWHNRLKLSLPMWFHFGYMTIFITSHISGANIYIYETVTKKNLVHD